MHNTLSALRRELLDHTTAHQIALSVAAAEEELESLSIGLDALYNNIIELMTDRAARRDNESARDYGAWARDEEFVNSLKDLVEEFVADNLVDR